MTLSIFKLNLKFNLEEHILYLIEYQISVSWNLTWFFLSFQPRNEVTVKMYMWWDEFPPILRHNLLTNTALTCSLYERWGIALFKMQAVWLYSACNSDPAQDTSAHPSHSSQLQKHSSSWEDAIKIRRIGHVHINGGLFQSTFFWWK